MIFTILVDLVLEDATVDDVDFLRAEFAKIGIDETSSRNYRPDQPRVSFAGELDLEGVSEATMKEWARNKAEEIMSRCGVKGDIYPHATL